MSIIGLFGSELSIKDGFSKAFSSFTGQANTAKNSVNSITGSIREAEFATGSFKGKANGIAEEYKKASNSMENNWGNSFKKIKNDGNNTFKGLKDSINNFSNSTLGTLSKLTAGYLSFKGAANLVNTSIKDASEFQNASVFLNAVYGEQQGKEKYKWATKEANDTPFEEGEVASGLARAKSLGLKDDSNTFKMYEDLGSYAKIQKVGDLNSAIDALSDAQNGEWMRLQTITGTKRAALEEYADAKGLGKFTNKKGQVTDKEKLMNVLKSYMDDKGISGMTDKFAKTADGRKSTLKGNIKKSLAELAGIADNGTIKDGSLFDKFSKGMETMITSVNNFSKSESFDKIADGLGKLGNSLIGGLDYITQHPELAENLVRVGGGLLGLKVASGLISPIASVNKLIGSTNGLTNIMGGLSGRIFPLTAGFLALGSVLSENGILHKGINSIFNTIAGNEEGNKKDYVARAVGGAEYLGLGIEKGLAKLTGNKEWEKSISKTWNSVDTDVFKADNKLNRVNTDWDTIPNMISNGSVTKNNTNNAVHNKTEVNLNVDTIRETADIDEVMNTVTKRLDKYSNTRNNLDY
ncbi:hypothetical protein [Clostridium sp. VAP41]|uniref:hypothetical protein n=1 Tax=Clostridium sp. VAP41 TaxID=2949979 RepID=UPI0020795A49|nr:hypothetical protein [Clostridium sp. VAP41]